MNRFFLSSLLVVFSMASASSKSFPIAIAKDTVIEKDSSIVITPYFLKTSVKALGNFAVVPRNPIGFQTYAGFNVMNTLHGHVPNFSSTSLPSSTSNRASESLLVIDGLPLTNQISNYYNLNSFEYESIYALPSGNATALYGGTGAAGGFFLQSKTGEDFSRPTFEVNVSPVFDWYDTQGFLTGEKNTVNQFLLTNAVAYKQDFGAVDTRVSYRYSWQPDGSADGENRAGYHAVRINTGLTLAPRLKARLILDDLYTKNTSSWTSLMSGQQVPANSVGTQKNLQGNLQLHYQILDWLTISSQTSLGKISNDYHRDLPSTSDSNYKQEHTFGNLYASANQAISDHFSFTAFLGLQSEKIHRESNYRTSGTWGESTSEVRTDTWVGGVGLQFNDYLFGGFDYRSDRFTLFPDDHGPESTWAANLSFVFSEAFDLRNSWFSSGKLRSSIGKNYRAFNQGYPSIYNNEYIQGMMTTPTTKKMIESGVDLGFLANRLMLTANYYRDRQGDYLTTMLPTYPWGDPYYVNPIELRTKGFEVIVGGAAIRSNNVELMSKLIWNTFKTEVEMDGESGGGSGATNLGRTTPDWSGSLLNQITYKSFFTSFLIDYRRGGKVYTYDYTTPLPELNLVDGTRVNLYDISIGYKLPGEVLKKLHLHNAQFSLSGQNLWTIYSKVDDDDAGITPVKMASASITVGF